MTQAEPPATPKSNPQPPTAEQAGRIVTASWRDPDWGTLVWTTMTTGVRRGELCGIRLSSLDFTEGRETIWLRRAVRRQPGAGWVEADLKTHQQRRIALDAETVIVLQEHIERCRSRAAQLGMKLPADAFLFSLAPDGSSFLTPDSVTQRYDRMASRLGIETTVHKLRHYSATELIAAGVDPRTVAGRLGHGGGGTTTLKTYSAWVSEADQRAAKGIGTHMPVRPVVLDEAAMRRADPRYPYEVVAAAVHRLIVSGELERRGTAPRAADLAVEHDVSLATAKRSLLLLVEWGELERGEDGALRVPSAAVVLQEVTPVVEPPGPSDVRESAGRLLSLTVRHRGDVFTRFSTVVDPANPAELDRALADAVARGGGDPHDIGAFEMDVSVPGAAEPLLTFVASRRSLV